MNIPSRLDAEIQKYRDLIFIRHSVYLFLLRLAPSRTKIPAFRACVCFTHSPDVSSRRACGIVHMQHPQRNCIKNVQRLTHVAACDCQLQMIYVQMYKHSLPVSRSGPNTPILPAPAAAAAVAPNPLCIKYLHFHRDHACACVFCVRFARSRVLSKARERESAASEASAYTIAPRETLRHCALVSREESLNYIFIVMRTRARVRSMRKCDICMQCSRTQRAERE